MHWRKKKRNHFEALSEVVKTSARQKKKLTGIRDELEKEKRNHFEALNELETTSARQNNCRSM